MKLVQFVPSSFILHPSSFLCAFLLLALPGSVRSDGGVIRLSEESAGYRITLFSEPTPLRAGPVDLSVLLQNVTTAKAILDAEVMLGVQRLDDPQSEWAQPATHEQATNKLYYAAHLELPSPGTWEVEVRIDGPNGLARVVCRIEVGPPVPSWVRMWFWICLPGFVIVPFCLYQLVRRRDRRSPGP